MSGRPTPAAARPDSLVPAPPGLPALLKRFPPRALELSWAATRQDREAVLGRLLAPPFTVDSAANQEGREAGVVKVLDWLTGQPGATWQEKWLASGAEQAGNTEWRQLASRHLRGHERTGSASRAEFIQLGRGLLPLLGADIVRPSLTWLLTPGSIKYLVPEMARSRDRAGFTRLEELAAKDPANTSTKGAALRRIAALLAARGGTLTDIAVGDCLQVVDVLSARGRRGTSLYFYQMLHALGVFPASAPRTVRIFATQGRCPSRN